MKVINQDVTDKYAIYHGDSCEVLQGIPENTIHFEIYSPPFASLYTYSNSDRDLGNCKDNNEFFTQFEFIASELFRVLMPGRLMSVHCMDIPAMKERDGYIGLIDFPGQLISLFQKKGFIYHSRVVIWKDPLIEATRTKALGLMHKQIVKDSALCRNGLPDYLLTFRKPGDNPEPVAHSEGFSTYIGEGEIPGEKKNRASPDKTSSDYVNHNKYNHDPVYSHQVWRRYASPVWMDINQTDTLQYRSARAEKDERHICPLQLGVIRRAVELWTNENDVVLSPFGGIGSEPVVALEMGRRAIAIELKDSYYKQMRTNCAQAVKTISADLFSEEVYP
ncbi:MAG: site-specific DNA-methyltransferase [Dysgonamonadaceae bacterium]|jgi:DNA modification methylase|nr:site-specific DNA-methyltransferase [Dysgonamonadaceae bacterium]